MNRRSLLALLGVSPLAAAQAEQKSKATSQANRNYYSGLGKIQDTDPALQLRYWDGTSWRQTPPLKESILLGEPITTPILTGDLKRAQTLEHRKLEYQICQQRCHIEQTGYSGPLVDMNHLLVQQEPRPIMDPTILPGYHSESNEAWKTCYFCGTRFRLVRTERLEEENAPQ